MHLCLNQLQIVPVLAAPCTSGEEDPTEEKEEEEDPTEEEEEEDPTEEEEE